MISAKALKQIAASAFLCLGITLFWFCSQARLLKECCYMPRASGTSNEESYSVHRGVKVEQVTLLPGVSTAALSEHPHNLL